MHHASSTWLRRLIYGLVVGILVYAAGIFITDADALRTSLAAVPIYVIVGACGLSAINYLLRFVKWHIYLRLLSLRVGLAHSFLVFLAGLLMAISPGKLGEVMSLLAKRVPLN